MKKEEIIVIRFCLRLFCLIFLLAGCGEKAEEQIIETQVDKYTVSKNSNVHIVLTIWWVNLASK